MSDSCLDLSVNNAAAAAAGAGAGAGAGAWDGGAGQPPAQDCCGRPCHSSYRVKCPHGRGHHRMSHTEKLNRYNVRSPDIVMKKSSEQRSFPVLPPIAEPTEPAVCHRHREPKQFTSSEPVFCHTPCRPCEPRQERSGDGHRSSWSKPCSRSKKRFNPPFLQTQGCSKYFRDWFHWASDQVGLRDPTVYAQPAAAATPPPPPCREPRRRLGEGEGAPRAWLRVPGCHAHHAHHARHAACTPSATSQADTSHSLSSRAPSVRRSTSFLRHAPDGPATAGDGASTRKSARVQSPWRRSAGTESPRPESLVMDDHTKSTRHNSRAQSPACTAPAAPECPDVPSDGCPPSLELTSDSDTSCAAAAAAPAAAAPLPPRLEQLCRLDGDAGCEGVAPECQRLRSWSAYIAGLKRQVARHERRVDRKARAVLQRRLEAETARLRRLQRDDRRLREDQRQREQVVRLCREALSIPKPRCLYEDGQLDDVEHESGGNDGRQFYNEDPIEYICNGKLSKIGDSDPKVSCEGYAPGPLKRTYINITSIDENQYNETQNKAASQEQGTLIPRKRPFVRNSGGISPSLQNIAQQKRSITSSPMQQSHTQPLPTTQISRERSFVRNSGGASPSFTHQQNNTQRKLSNAVSPRQSSMSPSRQNAPTSQEQLSRRPSATLGAPRQRGARPSSPRPPPPRPGRHSVQGRPRKASRQQEFYNSGSAGFTSAVTSQEDLELYITETQMVEHSEQHSEEHLAVAESEFLDHYSDRSITDQEENISDNKTRRKSLRSASRRREAAARPRARPPGRPGRPGRPAAVAALARPPRRPVKRKA